MTVNSGSESFRRNPLRILRELLQLARARERIRRLGVSRGPVRRHDLPAKLVVSLTSYPARYRHLHRTIRSLLDQSVRPDAVILWLSHGEETQLPASVTDLTRHGLTIRTCPDVRSYNKLIHTRAAFPEAFIVTADDDLYYEPRWLEALVEGWDPADGCIVCHRAHRMLRKPDGTLMPYESWEQDVQDDASRQPSTDLLPTGVGGILYPPGSLHADTANVDEIRRLAPTADDLWFYWMARRAGTRHKKVGGRFRLILWPGTQTSGLKLANLTGLNDEQARKLLAAFGDPVLAGPGPVDTAEKPVSETPVSAKFASR
jgi:hypothetical protein